MKNLIALIAALVAVNACGAQESGHRLSSNKSATSTPVVVAIYGDSTVQGWTYETGTYTITPHNAPAQLSAMSVANGYNVSIVNNGVFGETTGALINGTGGVPRPWGQEMAMSTAKIVIINDGLNDAYQIALGAETMAQFMANIQQLIATAQGYGKTVFIESPNPRTDSQASGSNTFGIYLNEINMAFTVKGFVMIDCYGAIIQRLPNWGTHLPDGVHPDDTMYAMKANVELNAIWPSLGNVVN
jgi:lysophospholipase L1-like esterase